MVPMDERVYFLNMAGAMVYSSKTWVKNVNLPKKVLDAVRSGNVYNNVKKEKREFGQKLSVLGVFRG